MTTITLRQPKGVALIALTQMWESFSFFGMRALLVLYLVSQAGFRTKDAFILYTLYIAFVKIFAGISGYTIDRFLGHKRAVLIGGFLIMGGHLLLTFSRGSPLFFLSLGSIVCGSALFRVSLKTLLGLLYDKEDERRGRGFTLLYVGTNLGGLAAAVLCGFVSKSYGWHAGFGLAAVGMMIGMAIFSVNFKNFVEPERTKKPPLLHSVPLCLFGAVGIGLLLRYFATVQAFVLPIGLLSLGGILWMLHKKMTKSSFLILAGSFVLLIAFFTAEELWGSLLMVFSETHIERTVFGLEIPSAAIAAVNPLTIVLLGPLFAKRELPLGKKLAMAFLCLACAFFILYAASLTAHASMLYLIAGLACIATGELFIAPTVLAFASKSAPEGHAGLTMGAAVLAFSMGSLLSGKVAGIPWEPSTTFGVIGICSLGICILLTGALLLRSSPLSRADQR